MTNRQKCAARHPRSRALQGFAAAAALWLVLSAAAALPAPVDGVNIAPASTLRETHLALRAQLANNPFRQPLVVESTATPKTVKGDIFAVLPHAFGDVSGALSEAANWCDILILHLNTKYCKATPQPRATALLMKVGKKYDEPLADSFQINFVWRITDRQADYLRVLLTADEGPVGTHDYRIAVEAVALDDGTTFMHLSYTYGFGLMGKLAMMTYLATAGRSKVGFSTDDTGEGGQPRLVGGMRGVVERNTMRYHLAIESFLNARSTTGPAQFEKRITDWFVASERYPQQLHEMSQAEYLAMKRRENTRQQSAR